MQFRAIATDLDGTLLRSDNSVSNRTRDAIEAAEAQGMLVVLATGRPPRWIPPVVDEIGERGLVVCANGASVYDPARHELVERTDLDPDVVRGLIRDLRSAFPEAVFSVEQGMDFAVDVAILGAKPEFRRIFPDAPIVPIESRLDQPVTKLICRLPPPGDPTVPVLAQEIVGARGKVTHSTQPSFLEISRPDVHKAATVERLLGDAGIDPVAVAAFGDMPNDIELLRWAGLGVAMQNAAPPVKEAADEVTLTNDDDGVAVVVERILGPDDRAGGADR